jgi:hypothetical protein
VLPLSTSAQKILVVGVNRVASCEFATQPLVHDLVGLGYPRDWTIVVACTKIVWQELQHRADAQQTETAFTSLDHRMTVLNGEIYRESLPLRWTTHRTPRLVLKHEAGHILCRCPDEDAADRR